jgi:hypothetical protein
MQEDVIPHVGIDPVTMRQLAAADPAAFTPNAIPGLQSLTGHAAKRVRVVCKELLIHNSG